MKSGRGSYANKKIKREGPVIFSDYKRGDGIKKALSISRPDILFELKDYKKALEVLQKFITKYPQSNLTPNALYYIGLCYENMKKHYEAMLRCTDGAQIKDFTLPAPDGKMVSLSDFKGKWVSY